MEQKIKIPVLTIDGLTASGKGTIAAEMAKILGFHCLDSGSLYRCLAWYAQQQGVGLDQENELVRLAMNMEVSFKKGHIFLKGEDITQAIRQEQIGMIASQVSAYPGVRQALLECQRLFAKPPGLVADGRDMGTVVFPNADLKIFLQANRQVRAERRLRQLERMGFSVKIEDLVSELEARDRRDQTRKTSPTLPAEDAIVLDSTDLTVAQVVEFITRLWRQKV
jgi:cytidylate kinase